MRVWEVKLSLGFLPSASALAVAVSQQYTIVCFLYGFRESLGTVARKAMPDMSGRDALNVLLW